MKLRDLMFLALLTPIAQPVIAQPAHFGADAMAQPSGGVPGGDADQKKVNKKTTDAQKNAAPKKNEGEKEAPKKNPADKGNTIKINESQKGQK